MSPDTTSDGAGAIWRPFLVNEKDNNVIRWGRQSFDHFLEYMRKYGCDKTGIIFSSGYELFTQFTPDPLWMNDVIGFRQVNRDELARLGHNPAYTHAWFYTTIVVDCSVYLPFITAEIKKLGGKLLTRKVTDLRTLFHNRSTPKLFPRMPGIVVNCTGLGAGALARDGSVYPVRGHTVRVSAPHQNMFYFDDEGPNNLSYIIPRHNLVVMGGTHQDHEWSDEISEAESAGVIKRCAGIIPELARAPIIKKWTGLRPGRPAIRLETELPQPVQSSKPLPAIIHNYGHAGSGITLGYGCAQDVLSLAQSIVSQHLTINSKL